MTQESYYEHLFGVRDKVVLVTGGTRGIGRMIAEGMVRCGARTYIASRKEDACREAEVQLSEFGFCKAITADISNLEGCQRLAETLRKHEESLEVLINNAGVTWSQKIEEFTEKAWDKVVDLDMKSPFFLSQQVLDLLKVKASPENRSVIINISSVNGINPVVCRITPTWQSRQVYNSYRRKWPATLMKIILMSMSLRRDRINRR